MNIDVLLGPPVVMIALPDVGVAKSTCIVLRDTAVIVCGINILFEPSNTLILGYWKPKL